MVSQNGHRYKLSYFNVRGFGEGIRMIFHYADVNFEDNRMEFGEEWDKLKPSKRLFYNFLATDVH